MAIKPITRRETYLNAMAEGNGKVPTPVTREELFLAKACGEDVKTPEPITRTEMYLDKIAEGGGSDVRPAFDEDGNINTEVIVASKMAIVNNSNVDVRVSYPRNVKSNSGGGPVVMITTSQQKITAGSEEVLDVPSILAIMTIHWSTNDQLNIQYTGSAFSTARDDSYTSGNRYFFRLQYPSNQTLTISNAS